ncbi:RHS repeat-associated core domain-containing protein [Luteibacter sp. UNCMF366Tsu5.1]|uniref:RHS repeat-associated core domain-containing protein n=1 Tax=Luteibacter sp. UNCMF366Tsu5.1 TaxID=1502758 RepID=UPI000908D92F|nr:RHS repeat-associated core domain-containing protein [Luteibacter sp. UNCMF366Tsu5.1]SFW68008.1 RHS repeat-associated core domain-containing protein [Luteibacter sp. UNCMF366Tsu5.1]
MSHHCLLRSRHRSLTLAVSLALVTGSAWAQEPEPLYFPSFVDGHLVPTPDGPEHHEGDQLDTDARTAAAQWCAGQPSLSRCDYVTHALREIPGKAERKSAYSVLDIRLLTEDVTGSRERIINGGISVVRSCPAEAVLVSDGGTYFRNRDPDTGRFAVACVSPDVLPKPESLGVPEESGANQCPIGNSPVVGNPINPLTLSKIEQVVDYQGAESSGLVFARTYHSGAFPMGGMSPTAGARYPAGARIGARWRHSFDRAFVRRPYYDANGLAYGTALYLLREDGRETRFVKQGDGFVPTEGERGKLREHPEGGWVYTWPDLTEERYDDKGRLQARTDANGNVLTLRYDDITVGIGLKATVLVNVMDRQGRELRLSYDHLGRVETVDTPDGRLNYSYSGDILEGLDADLVKVGYPDGHNVQYRYDEPAFGGTPNHKLTGIIGKDGRRFATFRYDSDNRAIGSAHGDDTERTDLDIRSDRIRVMRPDQRDAYLIPAYASGVIRLGQRQEDVRNETVTRDFNYLGGLVTRQTDYLGVPTTYQYDRKRQLEIERTEAEGTPVQHTVTTRWHTVFDKPTRIDNGSHWTTFEYDEKGNLIEQRQGGAADAGQAGGEPWPEERITRLSYDAAGRLLTIDGPLDGSADTTRYAYRATDDAGCATGVSCAWRKGDLHTITDPLGHVQTVLAYDAAGRVLASTDSNGARTERTYDAMGRPLTVTMRARRDGAPSAQDIVVRTTYTANGDVHTLTDPDGGTLTHRYNAARRLIGLVDAVGRKRNIERDAQGWISRDTFLRADNTEDLEREFTYDSRGIPERIQYSGYPIDYDVDANGRLLQAHGSANGPLLRRDARGRVDRITQDPESEGTAISLDYDGTDKVKTVVDPKGLSTGYLRNGLGDLLWQGSPDTGETAFEHDAAGQPVRETPADARTIERTYDAAGRLTTVTYSDGASVTYAYDQADTTCAADATYAVGHLSKATDRDGHTSFCYDFAGRVVQKTQVTRGVRLDLRYAYTPAGRLAAMTYPDGRTVSYTRDAVGQVVAVTTQLPLVAPQPLVTDVRYDALGQTLRWTAGARTLTRSYNPLGLVTGVHDRRPGGLNLNIEYIDSEIESISAGLTSGFMSADGVSRLTMATWLGVPAIGHQYTYDTTGNRMSWNTGALQKRRFDYAADSHRLLMAADVPREYDANGNTTRIGDREFVYDASGRMSQAKINGVVEMNYVYNPFGQQIAKYIAGQTTVSLHDEAGHWLGDYDGAGRPIRQVAWLGDMPIVAFDGDAIRDIQPDHLGTPRVVIDRATDKPIWAWSIVGDAFGSDAPNEDPDGDGTRYVFDMRFPGQRFDAVTGLHQNGWRDYDPLSGRYVQSDPIGLAGGISTYAYVGSNPYLRVDPLGLHVNGIYDKKTNQLTLVDADTGETISQMFVSGGKPYGDPIPSGWYDILERKGKDDFYRLEPIDSTYGDDVHEGTGRNNFRLHRPGMTIGCISANSWDDWRPIDQVLQKTSTDRVTVRSMSRWPGGQDSEELIRYGRIRVEN